MIPEVLNVFIVLQYFIKNLLSLIVRFSRVKTEKIKGFKSKGHIQKTGLYKATELFLMQARKTKNLKG